jgi:hypothetical protein
VRNRLIRRGGGVPERPTSRTVIVSGLASASRAACGLVVVRSLAGRAALVGGYPIPHFKQAKPISLSL